MLIGEVEQWVQIAQNLGVSFMALLGLGYAVWRSIVWIATHILKPMVDKHIAFLDTVSKSVEKQALAVEALAATKETEVERFKEITIRLERIQAELAKVQTMVVQTKSVQIIPGGSAPTPHPQGGASP